MTGTITTETIDVPRNVLDAVVAVFATAAQQGRDLTPEVTDALRAALDPHLPAGTQPGCVRISAEHAWHLSSVGDALDVYDLPEDDPATWQHPAVAAQQDLDRRLYDQAPDTARRLTAELEASLADTR